MAAIIITIAGIAVRICSNDLILANSVDVSQWSESEAWDAEHLKNALRQLDAQLGTKNVNCVSGINRSPTLAILYFWKSLPNSQLGAIYDTVEKEFDNGGESKLSNLVKDLVQKNVVGAPIGRASRHANPLGAWRNLIFSTWNPPPGQNWK